VNEFESEQSQARTCHLDVVKASHAPAWPWK